MSDVNKLNPEELENAAGGMYGTGEWKTVYNITSGYLAIRTRPEATYESEINHTGLHNGDKVQITGSYVSGPGFGGMATYVWVYSPLYNVSGYVNAAYLR